MTIQVNATAATARQLSNIRSSLMAGRASSPFGQPITSLIYTGDATDFALQADGTATLPATWTEPADAVAAEYWVNSINPADKLYIANQPGVLSTTGTDLATRSAFNDLNCFHVVGGEKIVIPFETKGVRPLLRFAGNGATLRCQGRYVSDASAIEFKQATTAPGAATTLIRLVGANGVQQIPFSDTGRVPVLTTAVMLRVVGPGPVRMAFSAVPGASATVGDFLLPGLHFLDVARMGVALTALRLYIPTGTNVVGYALFDA